MLGVSGSVQFGGCGVYGSDANTQRAEEFDGQWRLVYSPKDISVQYIKNSTQVLAFLVRWYETGVDNMANMHCGIRDVSP